MPVPLRVLILEDRAADAALLVHELRQGGFAPDWRQAETEAEFVAALGTAPDVILADYSLPQFDAPRALQCVQQRGLDIPFLVVSGSVGEDLAVAVVKQGAADYLLKDRLARLGQAVQHALEQKRLRDETKQGEAERARLLEQVCAGRERLQALARRLLEAQEVERRHLARELHDELGQALTAVKLNLFNVRRAAGAAALPGLTEGIRIVERALQQVRDLSLDLRPAVLDDLGLVAALRWYLDRQSQRAGLAEEFAADPPDLRLSPELETACFRVAQEALTNVVRHARARWVSVALRRQSAEVCLVIRDDGAGFDVAAARTRATRGGSLGLLGMQERVLLTGGEIDIVSDSGQGTEVRARWPLTSPFVERRRNGRGAL
ncbi:MAG TPA: ATP-binding protein [Gemmataceae bacterium]|nr:ATP-binding protein [Gemmataceae bacterium]